MRHEPSAPKVLRAENYSIVMNGEAAVAFVFGVAGATLTSGRLAERDWGGEQ
jgi:hypothetical protein